MSHQRKHIVCKNPGYAGISINYWEKNVYFHPILSTTSHTILWQQAIVLLQCAITAKASEIFYPILFFYLFLF